MLPLAKCCHAKVRFVAAGTATPPINGQQHASLGAGTGSASLFLLCLLLRHGILVLAKACTHTLRMRHELCHAFVHALLLARLESLGPEASDTI